jgi:hypothetical protein
MVEKDSSEQKEAMLQLKVDINYRAPPPDPELLEMNPFILVRHAVTLFNTEFARIVG